MFHNKIKIIFVIIILVILTVAILTVLTHNNNSKLSSEKKDYIASVQTTKSDLPLTTLSSFSSLSQPITEEIKQLANYNCELKPDEYTEIIDLENDCFAFSSRSMCDFENKEPEIKELKSQLYEESTKLYNQYKPKLVSKYSSVVMSCEYIDPIAFEFGLNLYDQEYFKQKFGEYSEGPAIRFSKLYSAKKTNGAWLIETIKDTSFNFENPPAAIITPPCLFAPQAEIGFQRIVQTDYGCHDLTIDIDGFDMSNQVQNDYFTYRLYDIDVISRDFAKEV